MKYYFGILNKRVIILLLLIIQSCGIRFFDGQGTFLLFAIGILSLNGLKNVNSKDRYYLIIISGLIFFNSLLSYDPDIYKIVFQLGLIFETYIVLSTYKNLGLSVLIEEFYSSLKLIFIHALIGYIAFLIIPNLFRNIEISGMSYYSLLHLFYCTTDSRNTGICWEPGLLQFMLNLFLFFSIKRNCPIWFLLLIVGVIVSTFSTTGFLILGLNYIFFFTHFYNRKKGLAILSAIITIVFFSAFVFIKENIIEKFSGENTSGLIRYRDFKICIELIKESPILGHGIFTTEYLMSKTYVNQIESGIFSTDFLGLQTLSGITNGFLVFFCWYGLPAGFYIYYLVFKNIFIDNVKIERIIFLLIFCLTLFSEPITLTSLFLLFPLSSLVLRNANTKIIMPPCAPKISIITAVFNGEKTIESLIQSIKEQLSDEIEFIIIDGASTDGTINIIKSFQNICYWQSEPDDGIYDAWNKGIKKATGDWIMFLGCDDILIKGSIPKYISHINQLNIDKNIDLISAKVQMVDKNGKYIRIKGKPFEWPKFLKEMTIAHPGALHSKKLFEKYGMFNTAYKIVGDYEFLLRPGKHLKASFLNEVTVLMSEGGASDSVKAIKEQYRAVVKSGQSTKLNSYLNTLIVLIKYSIRKSARIFGLNVYLRLA